MTQIATTRQTFGMLLGTAATAATTLTSTFDTIGSAVGMASSYVNTAAKKQDMDNKLSLAVYEDDALARLAEQDALRKQRARQFMAQSESHAEDYKASYERLQEVLRPKPVVTE